MRDGLTNEQISEHLGIGFETAKSHVAEILSKLGVATREEAAAWQPEPARAGPHWSLAFQIWLTAAAAVALIAVGVLAWGVFRGGDDEQAGVITSPSPTSAPSAVESQSPAPTFFPQPRPNVGANVRSMQLVSLDFAWILTDSQLTSTQFVPLGEKIVIQTKDITPPGVAPGDIRGFHFLDSGHGWLVANGASDPSHALQLIAYRTSDGGDTWQSSPLGEPDLINTASTFTPAFIDFLNASTGWVVAKTGSGTNFSVGSLFRTDDGGVTWTKLSIPTGDPVYFTDANNGWAAGGVPFHSKLYVTRDGGASWQDVFPPETDIIPPMPEPVEYGLPVKLPDGSLLLPTTQTQDQDSSLSLMQSTDNGTTWTALAAGSVIRNVGFGFLSFVFPDGHVFSIAGNGTIGLGLAAGSTELLQFPLSGIAGGVLDIQFADDQHGWAIVSENGCFKSDCWSVTFIEQTDDGGQTWTPLIMPGSTPTPFP
jgi:photosystem II stability/assembly factor-like uncharacterized protein